MFDKPCAELGKIRTSKPCQHHTSHVFGFTPPGTTKADVKPLELMAQAMQSLTLEELQILGALLLNEKNTRRHGFKFYQKVYYRMFGDGSYLSHFVSGRVLDASKESVRLMGFTTGVVVSVIAPYTGWAKSVFTAVEFKEIKRNLVKEGRLVDPNKDIKKPSSVFSGEIATLDLAVKENLVDSETLVSRKDSLVSIVARMMQGHILRPGDTGPRQLDHKTARRKGKSAAVGGGSASSGDDVSPIVINWASGKGK